MNDQIHKSVEDKNWTPGVRESQGHRAWAIVLAATIFVAPSIALQMAKSMAGPDAPLLAYFLVLPLIMLFILMLLYFMYHRKAYEKIYEGQERALSAEQLSVEEWKGVTRQQKLFAIWRGFIRLEFFGWIVWVTASVMAITGAIKGMDVTKIRWGDAMILTLGLAAHDLTRATVIATIVLFFPQVLKNFQNAIVQADKAAREAERAARKAGQAVSEAGGIVPKLGEETQRALGVLESTLNFEQSNMISYHLAQTLERIANSNPALEQVRRLSVMIVNRLRQINEEITSSYTGKSSAETKDHFDLVTLAAIYTTYLEVEALSFEGDTSGQRGCRLSTRFAHYALAVRAVVEGLQKLEPDRYRFYTILNRTPEHFFNTTNPNTENPQVDMNWSLLFLEQFCRSHHQTGIFYARYFVTCRQTGEDDPVNREREYGKKPPNYLVVKEQLEDDKYFILCNIKADVRTPLLWGPSAWPTLETSEHQRVKDMRPSRNVRETLADLERIKDLADPSYVIVDAEGKRELEEAVAGHAGEIEFFRLRDVMRDYHSENSLPQLLRFDSLQRYWEFFRGRLPRDLFAAWDNDKQCWCLCVGTMVGESDPTAVVMAFTTKDRALNNLPWNELDAALTRLFRPDTLPEDDRPRGLSLERIY